MGNFNQYLFLPNQIEFPDFLLQTSQLIVDCFSYESVKLDIVAVEGLSYNLVCTSRYSISIDELGIIIEDFVGKNSSLIRRIKVKFDVFRNNHKLLKSYCTTNYPKSDEFDNLATEYLINCGIWKAYYNDTNEELWDKEWDLEYYPILWRAPYFTSFSEFCDLYRSVFYIKIGGDVMYSEKQCNLLWSNIDEWYKIMSRNYHQ